jgi:predicted secreted protein
MVVSRAVKRVADSTAATSGIVIALFGIAIAGAVRLFGLTVSGAIALYFVIWWTFLFAVLPFGVRSQVETGEVLEGSEPGAPVAPALREKVIWTSVVAACILLGAAALLPIAGL